MANLWHRFRAMLPTSPSLAGVITTDHGDDTYTVTLSGGGKMLAAGGGISGLIVGDHVLVRERTITEKVPALTEVTIEI